MGRPSGLALPLVAALTAAFFPAPALGVTSGELIELHDRIADRKVDSTRRADAAGRALSRPGLEATFASGEFHPVVRGDGRVVGLVFRGEGAVTLSAPDPVEAASLARALRGEPGPRRFGQAWILFTDDTLDSLVPPEAGWTPAPEGAPGAVALHQARHALLMDPRWEKWTPALELDVLEDLFGAGFVGGHVLVELDVEGAGWIGYLHNPRGALDPGRTTSIFTHASRASAPHLVHLVASFDAPGTAPPPAPTWDMISVDVDLTARAKGMDRDLSTVALKVEQRFTNTAETPVRALTLDLGDGVRRCVGDEDFGRLKVSRIRDYADKEPAALHRRGRLFVALNTPLGKDEVEVLRLEYGGPLVQPVKDSGAGSNARFTPLQGWAWYPRPLRSDRHQFAVTFHTDRFVRGVATGDLVSDVDDPVAKGRTMRYEEKGGVFSGAAMVGEYVVFESDPAEGHPRIRLFTLDSNRQIARQVLQDQRRVVRFMETLWGRFPYSSLNMVDVLPMPSGNWNYDPRVNMTGATEAGWTCSPPGDLWPWEGFADSSTGCLSIHLPTTAPSTDRIQANTLNQLWTQNPNALLMYQAARTARQWWGQMVGPARPEDTWLVEGIASWSAALMLHRAKGDPAFESRVKLWHDYARGGSDQGPLALGSRLGAAFPDLAWGKGPAVISMLAERVGSGFLVHTLQAVLNRPPAGGLSTEGVQKTLEGTEAGSLEPFFDFWVRGTALPSLTWSVDVKQAGGAYEASGTIRSDPAAPGLVVPVAIHLSRKKVLYEAVTLTGPETPFSFSGLESKPSKVELDPQGVVLSRGLSQVKAE